jgi:hypothetical protein
MGAGVASLVVRSRHMRVDLDGRAVALPFLLISLLGGGARAAIVYDGSLVTNACGTRTEQVGFGVILPWNQSDLGSAPPGLSCSSSARNAVGPGQLQIAATSAISGAASFGEAQTDASAYFMVDDLVITGPGATASGVVRLHVDGVLNLVTTISGNQNAANDTATWLLSINTSFGSGETRWSAGKFLTGDGEVFEKTPVFGSFGILDGYVGGTTVVELPFTNLPTNTDLDFFLAVLGQTEAQASGCAAPDPCDGAWTAGATGELNFLGTVSLVEGEAAFVFGEGGYLANSTSMHLRDNHWLGVPEPESALLPLSALTTLALLGRKRSARRPLSEP